MKEPSSLLHGSFVVTVSSSVATAAIVIAISFVAGLTLGQKRQQQKQQQQQKQCTTPADDDNNNNFSNTTTTNVKENDDTNCIYLDYNGTTPIHPKVYQSMIPYLTTHYGNPSSSHWYGQQPKHAIEQSRKQILQMLGCCCYSDNEKDEPPPLDNNNNMYSTSIVFTGCGTESNNMAIHLALERYYSKYRSRIENNSNNESVIPKPHIVTSCIEHPAIIKCLQVYEKDKQLCTVSYVPVESDGRIRATKMISIIEQSSTPVILVTLMLANNETGAIQPVQEVSNYCRKCRSTKHNTNTNDILFHIDAAQGIGKISTTLIDLGDPDMITIVGHKIGAPKGIACLYIRPNCLQQETVHSNNNDNNNTINGYLLGGGQEFGLRSGTENVPYIVGLGTACELCTNEWYKNSRHMEQMRKNLWNELQKQLVEITTLRINGPTNPNERLPNTLSVGIAGIHSHVVLSMIGKLVAASAGAACHSSTISNAEDDNNNDKKNHHNDPYKGISSVLVAMKVPIEYAQGTIRFSVGPHTTSNEIQTAATIVSNAVKEYLSKERVVVVTEK